MTSAMQTTTPSTSMPHATALLIMDVQPSIVAVRDAQDTARLMPRLQMLRASARDAGIMVVYVVVRFRAGHPEIGDANPMFGQIRAQGRLVEEDVHPDIAPGPGEIVVHKRRVSAFSGSDLGVILRAHRIEHLVLCGIATSGVVLSTVREAADLDYRLTVIEDCCLDGDEDVQRVLMTKVFPRQALVVTAHEFVSGLPGKV